MFEQGVIFQIAWLNKPLQNEKIRPLGLPRKETEILQEQNFPWANFSFSLISRTVQPRCARQTTVLSISENKKLSLGKFSSYSISFLSGNPRGIYILIIMSLDTVEGTTQPFPIKRKSLMQTRTRLSQVALLKSESSRNRVVFCFYFMDLFNQRLHNFQGYTPEPQIAGWLSGHGPHSFWVNLRLML